MAKPANNTTKKVSVPAGGVFGENNRLLHVSQITAKDCPLWLSWPAGVPTLGAILRLGIFTAVPGYLPVVIQSEDWDLFHVMEGKVGFWWASGQKVVAGRGDFCLLPPQVSAKVVELEPRVRFFYTHFDFRPPAAGYPGHELPSERPSHRLPVCFRPRKTDGVTQAMEELEALRAQRGTSPQPWHWRLEAALVKVLGLIVQMGQKRWRDDAGVVLHEHAGSQVRDGRLRRVLRLIEAAPAQAWNVADLAQQVDLSPGHLHALSREMLGMSLKRHIVLSRLRLAIRLMKRPGEHGPLSLKEVARQAGFSSQHFFSRQFHEHFGQPPGDYRQAAGDF